MADNDGVMAGQVSGQWTVEVEDSRYDRDRWEIWQDARFLFGPIEGRDRADKVVKAANMHDRLVAALENLERVAAHASDGPLDDWEMSVVAERCAEARALLAEAEQQP